MINHSPSPPAPRGPTDKDRRVATGRSGAAGRLRRLKALLVRPIELEWQGIWWRLVLIERRHADPLPSLVEQRDELRARLLSHSLEHATKVMRHLGFVYDQLGRNGWAGVETLPLQVLEKALVQARMLASEENTPALAVVIDNLQQLRIAAEVRAERLARRRKFSTDPKAEVSEATREEYDEMDRAWVPTVPPVLPPPTRDN